MQTARAPVAIALCGLLLALLALPALAQTTAEPAKSPVRVPAVRAPDAEEAPSSVPVDETVPSEPEPSKTAPRNTLIEPYPQNPRCYVAGVYMPAPPTCPN